MPKPLDREIRKSLVRLAEDTSKEHSDVARIILALSGGRDEQQIATAVRLPLRVVREWITRYEAEGLAIFGDVFKAIPSQKPAIISTNSEEHVENDHQPQQEDDSNDEQTDEDPLHVRRHQRERQPSRKSSRRRERRSDEDQLQQVSVDEAVIAGFEGLLDDFDSEALVTAMPKRQVLAHSDLISPLTDKAQDSAEEAPSVVDNPDTTQPISVGALAAAFKVDVDHARHISQLSRELFDATASIHRLTTNYRDLLHAGALLHNIAYHIDHEQHHIKGRDLILQYTLKDISDEERQIIAVMTALHRLNNQPQKEPTYMALSEDLQTCAVTVAAILRMGIGFDYSHKQSSTIIEWRDVPGEIVVVVGGADAAQDSARAQQKSDLWNQLYRAGSIRFVTEEQLQVEDTIVNAPSLSPQLDPMDSSTAVSTKLRQHFAERLDYLVKRVRRGESGLLVPLWQEFQRLVGIWDWLLPGTKPRQAFSEDAEWLQKAIHSALFSAAVSDRSQGLLNDTDPDRDDPNAIQDLQKLSDYYGKQAKQDLTYLQNALQSRRYARWLTGVKSPLKTAQLDNSTYANQVAERAWTHLSELRQVMDRIKQSGLSANLEVELPVDTVQAFEVDLRLLNDILIYSASLLGSEYDQVTTIVQPLVEFVQSWQRAEIVTQRIEADRKRALQAQLDIDESLKEVVFEAFAKIMRERANEMRYNLVDMWEPLNTHMFRRAFALAVAKP